MTRHVLLALLLLADQPTSPFTTGGFDFPAKNWPNMAARLHVQVADEPDADGFAHVRLTVEVEGPATLEVESVRLSDATAAWKVQPASAWQFVGGRVRWEVTFDLRLVKPGHVPTPIPSVKIRCRASDSAPWEEAEWTDILADLRTLRPPALPAPVPVNWLSWLLPVGVATVVVLTAGLVLWKRAHRPPPRAPTLAERTLAELDRTEAALSEPTFNVRNFCESLSSMLRRYIAERLTLPAPRQTTAEFLNKVRETMIIDETQRGRLQAFLERCDLVKFAGASHSVVECRELADFVRTFIRDREKAKQAATLAAGSANSE
jgi:hypothetical protein